MICKNVDSSISSASFDLEEGQGLNFQSRTFPIRASVKPFREKRVILHG